MLRVRALFFSRGGHFSTNKARVLGVADAVNCSANFVITNQADADELKGCPVVGGSVHFVNATGDIRIEGVQVILGALFTDDWKAPPMKSLYCDVASVNNIWLSNMTQIKSIDFPNLQQVDAFSLTDMPELTTLRLPQFALRARSSQFWNLAKLRELELSDELFPGAPFDDIYPRYPVGEVKAAYITQEVADALFNTRKTRSYPDVAIGHSPDIKNLNFSGTSITSLTIEAGGDMTLTLPTASYAHINEVSITGVKEIKAAGTKDGKVILISANNVTIHNNTAMTELFLPFSVANELRITSNPVLERVFWHETLIGRLFETGKSLIIQDNAKLALQSSFKLGDGDDKFDGTFSLKMPWQNIGTSSAVFRGKFDNAFL